MPGCSHRRTPSHRLRSTYYHLEMPDLELKGVYKNIRVLCNCKSETADAVAITA